MDRKRVPRDRRWSLARQFLLTNLAVLVVGTLITGAWVGQQIEGGVLSRTAAVTALYVDSVVAPAVQPLADRTHLGGPELAALDRLLADTPLGEHIVEFKIWSPEGEVLYTSDRRLVGQRFAVQGGLARALTGEVAADLSDLDEPENAYLRQRAARLLEVYAPVRQPLGGPVIGVVEFYQLPTELESEIAAARWRSWAVVAGIALSTYLLVAGIVKRGSDTIARQQAAVRQHVARLARLAEQNAQLYREAAAALRARDEFLSVAAHELKTPVTNLHGYAQLLRRETAAERAPSPTRLDRSLSVIERESAKLDRLVRQLLDVARIEAGKLPVEYSPTDLVALLRGVVESARLRSGRQALHLEGPAAMIAEVDALRIEQVMANVVDNALKYSPRESAVQITVDSCGGGCVRMTVRDWGDGIPPESRPHIFDRFYQAHVESHRSGMGLGLWICRQIVELHGGRIWVEFPADGGTQIVVDLPTASAGGARGGATPPATGLSNTSCCC